MTQSQQIPVEKFQYETIFESFSLKNLNIKSEIRTYSNISDGIYFRK